MSNVLNAIVALALAAVMQSDPVNQRAAGTFYSDVHGRRLAFVVSRQDAESSPRWLDTEDRPPLSERAAVGAATELLPTIVPPGPTWRIRSVTLNPILLPGVWLYLVKFMEDPPLPTGGGGVIGGGVMTEITMVVLMDGRAIVPIGEPH